jgi:hypothetical protein
MVCMRASRLLLPRLVLACWASLSVACGTAVQAQQPATGDIEGRISFSGTPPRGTQVEETGSTQPVLYVNRTGGLRHAVVYLPDARQRGEIPPPAIMNQRRFVFEPQVLAVRAVQLVRFTNDDPANHNVRAHGTTKANTFSINTASGAVDETGRTFVATPAERPLELSCDLHPWMAAWLYVFDHDHFAVSDATGAFRLEGVPAGRHRIAVRQPGGRLARNLAVDVVAGQTARIDVVFTAADLGMGPTRR